MTRQEREWTDRELDRLRQMDERGVPVTQIAEALLRDLEDIEERVRIVRSRAPGPGGVDAGGRQPFLRDDKLVDGPDGGLDIGTPLEDGQPDIVTRELRDSDDSTQQATRPPGLGPNNADPKEGQREFIRDAERNAEPTNEAMRKAGFGDHKGTEGT